MQAAAVALGALPVFWLARKHLGSETPALGFAFAYLLYPATQWLALNEFHPVAFACPLLLYAFWYLDEDRLIPFAVFAVLAIACKEEIGLVVAGFGVWYVISRRRWKEGAGILAAGVAVSAVAVEVVVPHFSGSASAFYSRYNEVGGLLAASCKHTVHASAARPRQRVLARPPRLPRPPARPARVPVRALAGAAARRAARRWTQRPLEQPVPVVRALPLHRRADPPARDRERLRRGARSCARRPRLKPALGPAVVVLAVLSNYWLGAVPVWAALPGGSTFQRNAAHVTAHDRITARAVALVPGDAVVSATNSLGAHLSARRRILSFPRIDDATWVAVDETNGSYLDGTGPLPMEVDVAALRRDPGWRLVVRAGRGARVPAAQCGPWEAGRRRRRIDRRGGGGSRYAGTSLSAYLPRWNGFHVGSCFGVAQSFAGSEPSAGCMNACQICAGKLPPETEMPWTSVIGISPCG